MYDKDQLFIQAAMDYLALLEREEAVSIPEFAARYDAELRDELAEYLELMLALGEADVPAVISPEEQAMAERAAGRAWQQAISQIQPAQTKSLTELRREQKLSVGKLAKELNLPVPLLARIERGGVLVASIPDKLIARLATVLRQTTATIQAALSSPQAAASSVRLSAEDGTEIKSEEVVSFDEALRASGATPLQQQEWG